VSSPVLLDTCALIWVLGGEKLRGEADAALQAAAAIPGEILVSPISAWEVGQLVSRDRLRLAADPLSWFQMALDGGMTLAAMPPAVLVAASFLPGARLGDPADRILVATARANGYKLMTRDRQLLKFASERHVQAIAC
jgi:PIN domain nuclease of toxin-antitoxin system